MRPTKQAWVHAQAQYGAHLPSALAQDPSQFGLGLNRQLLPQGLAGANQGLPQGLDGASLSRGIDHFFPQGGGAGLGSMPAGNGNVPLMPLQVGFCYTCQICGSV